MKKLGPYKRTDGRFFYVIKSPGKKQTTKLVSRVLMEEHLGRELESWENVDHINGDKTDDRIENLQILSREANSKKSAYRRTMETSCPICKCIFVPARYQVTSRSLNKAGPFCSRKCAGIYSMTPFIPANNTLVGKTQVYENAEGKIKITTY